MLSGRAHAASELERKLCSLLLRKRAPAEAARSLAASVCGELSERGLLDDATYARWHVAQRDAAAVGARRPRSRAQLAGELLQKGVPLELVRGAVAEHSELASCAAAALRRPALRGAQLSTHLKFKGFPGGLVARVARVREEGGEGALAALVEQVRCERAAAAEAAAVEAAAVAAAAAKEETPQPPPRARPLQ